MPPLAARLVIEALRDGSPAAREMVATLAGEAEFFEVSACRDALLDGPPPNSAAVAWLPARAVWLEYAFAACGRIGLLLTEKSRPIAELTVISEMPLGKRGPTYQLALGADLPDESREAFAERQGLSAAFIGEIEKMLAWCDSPAIPRRRHRPSIGFEHQLRRSGALPAGSPLRPWVELLAPPVPNRQEA